MTTTTTTAVAYIIRRGRWHPVRAHRRRGLVITACGDVVAGPVLSEIPRDTPQCVHCRRSEDRKL